MKTEPLPCNPVVAFRCQDSVEPVPLGSFPLVVAPCMMPPQLYRKKEKEKNDV